MAWGETRVSRKRHADVPRNLTADDLKELGITSAGHR
ncbi:hypothetical protein [Caballeronia choica]